MGIETMGDEIIDPHLADLLELRRISQGSESEAYAWPRMMRALQTMVLRRQVTLAGLEMVTEKLPLCQHDTALVLHTLRPGHDASYRVLQCTWGCGEYLIQVDDLGRGVTRTWAVSQLLALQMSGGRNG